MKVIILILSLIIGSANSQSDTCYLELINFDQMPDEMLINLGEKLIETKKYDLLYKLVKTRPESVKMIRSTRADEFESLAAIAVMNFDYKAYKIIAYHGGKITVKRVDPSFDIRDFYFDEIIDIKQATKNL